MLVCHCHAIKERRIREEIERGASDEFDIAAACGAGTGCGGCVSVVSELLAEYGCAPRWPVASALRALAPQVAPNHLDAGTRRP